MVGNTDEIKQHRYVVPKCLLKGVKQCVVVGVVAIISFLLFFMIFFNYVLPVVVPELFG